MLKILKLAYNWNYCTDSYQILHSDKDHQILFVVGLNRLQQIQDGRRPPSLKIEKWPYLRNGLTDRYEI